MYSEKDILEINGRIRKTLSAFIPTLIVLIAVYVAALIIPVRWLVYAAGILICIAIVYGLVNCLIPQMRYRRFLLDMASGLSREMQGTIVEIAQKEDLQDGVRVLPVRIFLDAEQDERIVYLNASKADLFPQAGEKVALRCYGRHIREAMKG